jgi:hypothetical protein
LPVPLLFALIFTVIWTLHAPLLRLPYFWDEAGYYVPAARDLLLSGHPIPTSTISNAHPPLVMMWLAFWWKFSAFTPAVTRLAMLLVAAFTLLGVFRLARQVSNTAVATASTLLTALYPVFFSQSSLAHLDMAAAGFTLWGLASYCKGNRWRCLGWFAVAGVAKETALFAPAALIAWEWVRLLLARRWKTLAGEEGSRPFGFGPAVQWSVVLGLSAVPIGVWLAYHYLQTGAVLGNPDYYRYNLGATLRGQRIALAFVQRLWHLFGYLNLFVLTATAALAMRLPPLPAASRADSAGETGERPRIALSVQLAFGAVILAYLSALSLVGGAVLARYLLPVYPLVIIIAVATLWRRLSWWKVAVGMVALAFVAGLFASPPYRISPEDNLVYADFVRLHKAAAQRISALDHPRVLPAWPGSDELQRPYLGYVSRPVEVVPIENFTARELDRARRQLAGSYDYALVFSGKYEPAHQLRGWWEEMQIRYFDYHRDVSAEEAAGILGGEIIYQQRRGVEWVAIIKVVDR